MKIYAVIEMDLTKHGQPSGYPNVNLFKSKESAVAYQRKTIDECNMMEGKYAVYIEELSIK